MAVTNADILGWLNANPNASPELINKTMAEAGVTAAQYQSATGSPPPQVQQVSGLEKVIPAAQAPLEQTRQNSADTYLQEASLLAPQSKELLGLIAPPAKELLGGPVQKAGEIPTTVAATSNQNPLVKLYQDTLGRTPSQAEIDSWNFGSTIDELELNRFVDAARNEAINTKPTTGASANLAKQILAQGTTDQWTGKGYGSAANNAADMGTILASVGITDISQFGPVQKTEQTWYQDEYGNNIQGPDRTITTWGNTQTGQALPSTYSDNTAFGGTYAGKGNTGYRVDMSTGKPIFYTTEASSKDSNLVPLVQMALMATGAGSLLGNALLGTGASQIAAGALGGGLLGAGTTALAGGDWKKGALLGGAGGALGGYLQGGGPIDASNMTSAQFNDALETQLIKTMQDAGLTTQQIGQWLENASPTDIASVVNTLPVTGASDQLVVEAAKTPITANTLTNVLSQVPTIVTTGAKTPEQVSPDTLNAVTSLLNNNLTATPTVEVKATNPNKSEVPVITPITSTLPVTPPTVEVTDKALDKTEASVITPITPVVPTTPITPTTPVTKDTKLTTSDIIKLISVVPTLVALDKVTTPTPTTTPQYPIVEVPSGWSPATAAKVAPATQLPAIDFGTRNLLKGTQWEKFLDPNYGKVPAPVQFSQPSNLSYSDLMGILGSKQGYPAASNLSINDVISGIQNQYGQAPVSTMG